MRGIKIEPRRGIILKKPAASSFFHVHAHSRYSFNDALPGVKQMVQTVVGHGQKALALTDHGNMAGAVQLYQECTKAGIAPFPGSEIYFVKNRQDPHAKRYHMGLLALNRDGYRALVRLSSLSHSRENFHHKPLLDWTDFAQWHENGWTEGLALTTGCYFGLVIQTLINEGEVAAKYLVHRLSMLFPHTFVELQNHQIDQGDVWSEVRIAAALFDISQELGLPIVVAQDAHYCEPTDKPVHETLKRVASFGPDADDAVFPGDGFHLSDAAWVRRHHEDRHWVEAQAGFDHLMDLHTLSIPELDKYAYNIPIVVEDPTEELTRVCTERLQARNLPQPYADRLGDELSVVLDTGMAGYLLLVAQVTDHCAEVGLFTQARGSASGSLICWLLGITQCDPIRYNLRFERFVSRDRTKPPDIDLDVEDSRRAELIEWLRTRYNVCQIGTFSTYSVKEEEGRGSLMVAFRKMMKNRGMDKDEVFKFQTLSDIPAADQAELLALSDYNAAKSAGTHAGGLIVTTTHDEFADLVPTMLIASSDTTVSQYTMNDVESLGLVKLDVLGLRTLSLLRICIELVGRDPREGLDWIPLSDARTFTAIRNGATDGVFQLEGGTAQRGCREVKVRSLKDIIVIQALYRPAVMNTGGKDTYIARREGREALPEMHPSLLKVVKETFGVMVFQEQVIEVLRMLGMNPDDLTSFLKAIKASQKADMVKAAETIAKAKDQVWTLAQAKGWEERDMDLFWPAVEGFGEYGFNRAHATAYGITAYRCAYLKTHYPLEFATALLQTSEGTDNESKYISAVRKMGISIRRPHINISGASYSIDRRNKSVRKGLVSISGIGERTAAEIEAHQPFDSVDDIIERCNARRVNGGKSWKKEGILNGHLGKLREAGALGDLV